MRRIAGLIATVALAWTLAVRAEGPDDQYVRIYNLIQQADALNDAGQSRSALDKYVAAQTDLLALQKASPTWNERVVKFRLRYLADKLAKMSELQKGVTPLPEAVEAAKPATPNPLEGELRQANETVRQLNETIRQLAADKALLDAKLREALSAQPAAVDPRELAKARERIRSLEKENEVLNVSMKQAQAQAAAAAGRASLAETQKALAEANRQLNQQAEVIARLTREKTELQNRPKSTADSTAVKELREENDALKRRLAARSEEPAVSPEVRRARELQKELDAQKARADALVVERNTLQKRLNALAANQAAPTSAAPEGSPGELAKLRAQVVEDGNKISVLESALGETYQERNNLVKQNQALQARLDAQAASARAATPAPARNEPALQSSADARKIEKLEKQIEDLEKKLAAAQKDAKAPRGKRDDTTAVGAQLATLRTRLEVLEAQKVPYTPEELALLKAPELPAPKPVVADDAKAHESLPAGAGPLIAQAQTAVAARRYDEAERNYQKVVGMDAKNIAALGNLAVVQMEQNRLPDAEVNLKKALAAAPDDAGTLTLMGILKFREKKFDDALDALSQAAKLDPKNAETQNFLGITLSEKGQRAAAEAALRKAVQLSPNYGMAHHNLAVIYATQRPPFLELARWHYQRALNAGNPPNAELEKLLAAKPAAAAAAP